MKQGYVGGVRDWSSYRRIDWLIEIGRRGRNRGKGVRSKLGRPEGTVRPGSIECSVTRKENANARLRQTASASRARGANKERRGENDRVTARNARAGARDSDGRNGQMRTEEQPEIVED